MSAPTPGSHAPTEWQSEEEQKQKRNRCCRPISILAIIAFVLLLIAAIIAIIVTSVADNFAKVNVTTDETQRAMEGSQDDLKPYSANLDELPAALKDQVLQSQQGYQQGFGSPSFSSSQYSSNGQQQLPNGYPSMYNGGPNVFQQVGPGYNGQTSGQPSSYGYSSSQQFNPSNQYNGRRRR